MGRVAKLHPRKLRKNIYLTELLIQSLRKTNIQRLLVAGSCWEYGNSSGQLGETTVQTPESHFAKAKLEVHRKFADYCNSVEASLIWARIFSVMDLGKEKHLFFQRSLML